MNKLDQLVLNHENWILFADTERMRREKQWEDDERRRAEEEKKRKDDELRAE